MDRRVEQLSVAVLVVIGLSYAVFPTRVGGYLLPGMDLLVGTLLWTGATLPRPMTVGIAVSGSIIVAIVLTLSVTRGVQ